ncbi:DUF3846 domain-containing protein [Romboutsia sp. 1001285H_161024_C4]|uniref:DUF3846 domain-containing protein n=1 Tax=Romboutsia sp. 1001285H_161024_C4 TaxID=2787109 RepID=UPI0018997DED|nr:DUF3846 domain-containing protein [Romboutsia sp. 1001285H_161024_C4]
MKGLLITTKDKFKIVEVDKLETLVDGNIEVVRPTAGYTDKLLLKDNIFVCDEEGHCKEKKNNYFGTLLYNGLYGPKTIYPIAGDIVIIGETEEDFRGLTEDEISYYTQILRLLRLKEVGD